MSKRKGRKQPLNSEIKSVLRAPEELESEPAPAPAEAGSEAPEADPELGDDLRDLAKADSSDDTRANEESGPVSAERDAGEDELGVAAAGADEDDREDEDEDGPSGNPFGEPFSLDGYEGDDTEGFLRGLVEALLFTSQKPVDLKDLARSAGIDKPRARELIEQLQRTYEGRGLCIEEIAGGFVMRSAPRYAPYIQKILALRPVRLSRAQLETLAIVAYRQPVTKPEVDDIRGVDSGQVIKGLLERALLKMLGKKDEPGRPTLYGTTTDFLELLNLQSLKDLPTLREYTELSEESQRKFLDETGESAPADALTFERPPSPEVSESPGNEADADAAPEAASSTEEPQAEVENATAADDTDEADDASDDDDTGADAEVSDTDEAEASASDEDDDDESDDDDDDDDDDESDDDESDDAADESDDDESDDDDDESDDDDDDDDDESDDDDDESDDDKSK